LEKIFARINSVKDIQGAYKDLSHVANGWLDTAVAANMQGKDFAFASNIQIAKVLDCLVNGLCLKTQDEVITMMA
jgi:hypothetical protein